MKANIANAVVYSVLTTDIIQKLQFEGYLFWHCYIPEFDHTHG